MNRLNIKDATKEQLIDIVKQLRQDIQRLQRPVQSTDGAVRNLEEQISQLQGTLRDANYEIRALREHNTILTEKSASDEETISMLIKRFEEVGKDTKDPKHHMDVGSVNGPSSPTGTQDVGKRTSSNPLGNQHQLNEGSNPNEHDNSAVTLVPIATLAKKNEEIAKLEQKVSELMEVNAFYSSIVSQQDEEERIRHAGATSKAAVEEEFIDIPALRSHVSTLRDQKSTLQRLVKQTEDERRLCIHENLKLREKCNYLEAELLELGRSQRALQLVNNFSQSSLLDAAAAGPQVRAHDNQGQSIRGSLLRIPAQSVVLSQEYMKGESMHPDESNTGTLAAPPLRGRHQPQDPSHPSLDIHSLRRINIRNPNPQERMLLERLELYENHIEQMEASEADRQYAFNEMERSRAELFTYMNEQLVGQRSEIQSLQEDNFKLKEALSCTQGVPQKADLTEANTSGVSASRELCDAETETDGSPFLACDEQEHDIGCVKIAAKLLGNKDGSETYDEIHDDMFEDLMHLEEKGRTEILSECANTLLDDLVAWYQTWAPFCLYASNCVPQDKMVTMEESLFAPPQGIMFMEERVRSTNSSVAIDCTQERLSESAGDASRKFNQMEKIAFVFENETYFKCWSAVDALLILYGNVLSEYNELAKACLGEATDISSDGEFFDEDDVRLIRDILVEMGKGSVKETTAQVHQLDALTELFEGPTLSIHNPNSNIDVTYSSQRSGFKEGWSTELFLPQNNGTTMNLADSSSGYAYRKPSVEGSAGGGMEEMRTDLPLSMGTGLLKEPDKANHSEEIGCAQLNVSPGNIAGLVPQLSNAMPVVFQQEAPMEDAYDSVSVQSNPTCKTDSNQGDSTKHLVIPHMGIGSDFCPKTIYSSSSTHINLQTSDSDDGFHAILSTASASENETSHISEQLSDVHSDNSPQGGDRSDIRARMKDSNCNADHFSPSSSTANRMPSHNSPLPTALASDFEVDKAMSLATMAAGEETHPPLYTAQTSLPIEHATAPERIRETIEVSSHNTDDTEDVDFEAEFNPFV
ncbi:unnamed protein product [Phytomonas sp. EM1]|nr:unnamed protein product [Phytomonas sp. EM1]|eukprot:CCW65329.1 unnamed protein product [Phytomonas sp. isolate EM1]